HRRPRREQPELERRLLRVLHRQPAIVAVLHVGMNLEPELLIEQQRLVLVPHVQTHNLYTLSHLPSVIFRWPFVPPASRRRFSKTEMLSCGRSIALTMQAGTPASASSACACARARTSPGLSPVTSRNCRPKVPRLPHPV